MIRSGSHDITSVSYLGTAFSKVVQGGRVLWESIRSCFGSGAWFGQRPWIGSDGWKGS
jgi:hypothetical protein